jgi:hypothetical protein
VAQEAALGLAQELIAPVDGRAQRLLARDGRPAATGEQAELVVEARRDALDRQHLDPRGGQLDRQRDAVQAPADLDQRGGVVRLDPETRIDQPRALDEQPDAGVADEGGDVRSRRRWRRDRQ